jgi:DNA-binding CsgD family transcriptional regulator
VQLVIARFVTDRALRRRVEQGGSSCLAGLRFHGIDLTRTEIAAFISVGPGVWASVVKQIDLGLNRRCTVDADACVSVTLTMLQQRVLRGVCDGLRNKDIAARLGLSESTVKAVLQQLFRKLSVRRRVQPGRLALDESPADRPYAVQGTSPQEDKRELRRDSAHGATAVAASTHVNLDRTLTFTLRAAFVQVLAAKAALTLARDNLTFYAQVLMISQQRFQAGDIAQVDLNRLQLQRVQFESAIETADVNLRTAKIQLPALLNDRAPVDQSDVTAPFDFADALPALDDLRRQAQAIRPDLRAAQQGVEAATITHRLAIANGSTGPTFTVDTGCHNLRTLDIMRSERLVDTARAQVLRDVDTAYATLVSSINLLRPYRDRYLAQSTQVRTSSRSPISAAARRCWTFFRPNKTTGPFSSTTSRSLRRTWRPPRNLTRRSGRR